MLKLLPLLALMAALALTGCDRSRSNTPPTANAGPHQTVNENTPVSLSGSGADAEDTVRYSWTQTSGTTVMLSGADTETASFTAPEVDEDEDLVFELTVTDADGASAADTVTATISRSEVAYTITTIAGSGAEDDEGSLATDTEAFLTSPRGVAVDDHGNVYVADTENHRIRKIDAESGLIATIAGTGEEGCGGDEGPATKAGQLHYCAALPHSTVTDFARLRGWSISHPRSRAT